MCAQKLKPRANAIDSGTITILYWIVVSVCVCVCCVPVCAGVAVSEDDKVYLIFIIHIIYSHYYITVCGSSLSPYVNIVYCLYLTLLLNVSHSHRQRQPVSVCTATVTLIKSTQRHRRHRRHRRSVPFQIWLRDEYWICHMWMVDNGTPKCFFFVCGRMVNVAR